MGKATVICQDGTEKQLDHRPTLKEAQDIVGGYVEFLHLKGQNITLVLDEDGRPKVSLSTREPLNYSHPGLWSAMSLSLMAGGHLDDTTTVALPRTPRH